MALPVEILKNGSSPLTQIMAHLDEAARQLSKTGTTLYAVLELKKGASPEDIKKAYRFRPSLLLNLEFAPLKPFSFYLAFRPIFKSSGLHFGLDGAIILFIVDGKEFRLGLFASILRTYAFLPHI